MLTLRLIWVAYEIIFMISYLFGMIGIKWLALNIKWFVLLKLVLKVIMRTFYSIFFKLVMAEIILTNKRL